MPDKTDVLPPGSNSAKSLCLAEDASAHAPFLYFEDVTAFGHLNGVVRITLEACRLLSRESGKVDIDRVVVAHLRMNLPAAKALKAAIDGVLLLAEPATSETRN